MEWHVEDHLDLLPLEKFFRYAAARKSCSYTQNGFMFWWTSSTGRLPGLCHGPQWGLPSARPTYFTPPL